MDITDLNERRKALGISLRTLSERSDVSYGSCWNFTHGRANRAIMDNYMKVVACLDSLEAKKRAETQEKEPCRK